MSAPAAAAPGNRRHMARGGYGPGCYTRAALIKVRSTFGTRPEAIKMAPVIAELSKHEGVIDSLRLRPERDAAQPDPGPGDRERTVRAGRGDRASEAGLGAGAGDTTTMMAAALAALYHKVKVGHVEAGLRTGDKGQPFPEEINRKIATAVCDLHFAPTETSRGNLLREGVPESQVIGTGNTVIDALKMVAQIPYDLAGRPLKDVPWDRRIILVTAHRCKNFGQPMEDTCLALRDIALAYSDDVHVV